MAPARRPSAARPPTTPPTMAPIGVLESSSSSQSEPEHGTGVVVKGRREDVVDVSVLGVSDVLVRVVVPDVEVSNKASKSDERSASHVARPDWPENVVSNSWKADVVTESQE